MTLKTTDIHRKLKEHNVQGLSLTLIDNGGLFASENYGNNHTKSALPLDTSTIFNACSMSKLVTTILVLKLVDDGILSLDTDVNHYLKTWKVPESEFTSHTKVTLRHLLSHQSGFTDPDKSFGPLNTSHAIPTMADLLSGKTNYYSKSAKMLAEPGKKFLYSDTGFCIVEQVLEDATNQSFTKLMNTLIFEPLNMNRSFFHTSIDQIGDENYAVGHHKNGKAIPNHFSIYPYPATAGLWSTSKDLSRLAIEIMDALNNKSTLGISTKTMTELLTPQGCSKWSGLGVFLDYSEERIEISTQGWGVGYQSMMLVYPRLGKGAVIMMNTDPGVHQLKGLIGVLMKDFAEQFDWPSN